MNLCSSKGCKVTSCQSWRFEKQFHNMAHRTPWYPWLWDHPQCLTDCNFVATWPTESHDTSLEISQTLSKQILSTQRTDRIFKLGFSLSKWPHFHSVYLLGVPIFSFTTVYKWCLPAKICRNHCSFRTGEENSFSHNLCDTSTRKDKNKNAWKHILESLHFAKCNRVLRFFDHQNLSK